MKKKILIITLIIVILFILIGMNYISNTNAVKEVVGQYDLRRFDVINEQNLLNYDDLIKNIHMKELAQIRDEYNLNWYKKTQEEIISNGFNEKWKKCYIIFNTCIIYAEHRTSIAFTEKPKINEKELVYNRIIILKKSKGKWYIEKDIIDYDKNQVELRQIFDKNYIKNEIKKYNQWSENIDIIVEDYLESKQ